MNKTTSLPEIVRAAQQNTFFEAARAYAELGLSVLPLNGKRPALGSWTAYQNKAATLSDIQGWGRKGLLRKIGLVCGAVSGNLVVLDMDGAAGYPAFAATFPHLADTYTVATGGGVGKHVYWRVDQLPASLKAMNTPIGNLEICANGRQVVAPPSVHPETHRTYRIEKALDILHIPNLDELVTWVESFRPPIQPPAFRPPTELPPQETRLNPRVIEELTRYFEGRGYRPMGDWLHGSCINPGRHKHGDRNPSFGFNRVSGYGYCYVCGTMLAKDICAAVGLDPYQIGGLIEKPEVVTIDSGVRLSDAPLDITPPEPPTPAMSEIAALKLPNWLQRYMAWAGATGNETPLSFHLAAGLWLLATAVGRRLYGEAPWGVKIYPNLYLMLVADTTYYRKSTAYKLSEQIARAAIPHMLMPTPGSPERFQEALAGRMPANFDKLSRQQQERLTKAQPFAAQRGLLKDEVAGLFGAINRKEYMTGMKDMLMELYDCPDYSDKDTQGGLTVVENAALSILGVTTPSGLSSAVTDADWSNGLLIRFALLTPETDYQARPAPKAFVPPPPDLVAGLHHLHERLPQPQNSENGLLPPAAVRLDVRCWESCQSYSAWLRELCNPKRETELDERLKGVYGRMHVQAFKLAALLAALDWMEDTTSDPAPVVTQDHWESGKAIAELWRGSAARLLHEIDRSGEAVQERREQDRMLSMIRKAGGKGCNLRDLYRNLNLSAKRARQLAQDLAKAGLIVETLVDRAEWYIAVEALAHSAGRG